MKKHDKLFDFIRSMSSHERGYFKQNANKNSYYVILFDAICKQHEYNENELIRLLKKHGCVRKISAIKDYLWQELTQAMAPYHLIKTPIGEALSQMQRLHLMNSKGLNDHIHKELESLKRLCSKYEMFDTLIQVMHFEFRFGYSEFTLKEKFWSEFHDAVYSNMIHMNLSEIQHRLYLIKLKNHDKHLSTYHLKEIDNLVNHDAMKDHMLKSSVRLRIIKEGILDLHASLINDFGSMLKHNMNIVNLLESKPHLLKDGREISLIYTNIVTSLAIAGQRKQLAGVIDEIITRFNNIKDHHSDTKGHLLEIKVIRALVMNDFSGLNGLQAEYKSHGHKIPMAIKNKLYYYFTVAHIKAGNTDEALDWINDSLTFYRKHKHMFSYYLDKIKVLHILIHYQLGSRQYVSNQIDSFTRTYRPVSKETDINLNVMRQLSKVVKSANAEETFIKLKKGLTAETQMTSNEIFIDLSKWLECIVTGTSYAEVCAQQATECLKLPMVNRTKKLKTAYKEE
ncbi:MAG: hypothetical protein U0T74_13705 [Chitinophagales bacterium]